MRYDAERILDEFAVSLQVRRPSDEIVAGWLGVISETMHPASAGVWMRSNRVGRLGPGMVAGSSTSVATHPER
jgi:hypothetical protein